MNRLLLLSGGLDSAAVASWQRPDVCLFIDYGQQAAVAEERASRRIAAALGLTWATIRADCGSVGSGLMAGVGAARAAPTTEWWPFRNQLLGTLAAAWAIRQEICEVLFGSVAGDGDRHRDGTAWFFEQLDSLTVGQEGAVRISAPALALSTEALIRVSLIDRSTLGWAFSCHTSSVGCGDCPGCQKRSLVLEAVGRELA